MARISHTDLARMLAQHTGMLQKDAKLFVGAFFDTIKDGLERDEQVKVRGLGTFKIIDIEARESIDVNSGERLLIKSHQRVTFTPDAAMKELVNKPFSVFETVVLNEGVVFDEQDDATDDLPDDEQPDEVTEEPSEEETGEEPDGVSEEVLDEDMKAEPDNVPGVVTDAVPEEETKAPLVEAVVEDTPSPDPVLASFLGDDETPFTEVSEDPSASEAPSAPEAPSVPEEPSASEVPSVPEEPSASEVPSVPEAPAVSEDPSSSRFRHLWLWILAFVLFSIASFGVGYLIGNNISLRDLVDGSTATPDTTNIVEEFTDSTTTDADSIARDTVATAAPTPAPQSTDEAPWKKYEDMDARVRTGAYHIVGTDQEIKARKGDTMGRIARRMLGDESMACYIEVYNGISSDDILKEGQTIKIPKLQWKKKKKKTNHQ